VEEEDKLVKLREQYPRHKWQDIADMMGRQRSVTMYQHQYLKVMTKAKVKLRCMRDEVFFVCLVDVMLLTSSYLLLM
jgi:hypothetical protein